MRDFNSHDLQGLGYIPERFTAEIQLHSRCDYLWTALHSKEKPSGGDGGKDGVIQYDGRTGKYNGAPLQVKQSEGVGVNVVKNLFATMHDMKKKNGFIVALSFGSGAVEQVAKYKLEDSVNIKLILAEDLLKLPYYDFNIGYDFGENNDAEWTNKKEPKKPASKRR